MVPKRATRARDNIDWEMGLLREELSVSLPYNVNAII